MLVAVLAVPANAESGKEAFARQDFQTAAVLFREEAAAGSSEAKLGLGLMSDLGLGTPRNPTRALRWYLEASEGGLPEAQFNVGVMLDAGAGIQRDALAAAVWYGRAAANGYLRAEYNLGLLYEAGDGVPRNPDLARYWLARAAERLSAASDRLAVLASTDAAKRTLSPPEILVGAVVPEANGVRAELVWAAPPGTVGSKYLVELARMPREYETSGADIVSGSTDSSALAISLPAETDAYAWRVSRVNAADAHYATRGWQRLTDLGSVGTDEAEPVLPKGRITLYMNAVDIQAKEFADELASSFFESGYWVRVEALDEAISESAVFYSFAEDAVVAGKIAEFLPVLSSEDTAQVPGASPGEIIVWLSGGPQTLSSALLGN